jgi:hypothetical protein
MRLKIAAALSKKKFLFFSSFAFVNSFFAKKPHHVNIPVTVEAT